MPRKVIPYRFYKKILDCMPILCVDLLIHKKGKYLLVKRERSPMKGYWFVPGGRVLKGESMYEAVIRKSLEETGVLVHKPKPIGFFEFDQEGIHSVSIVFRCEWLSEKPRVDSQSSDWKWSKEIPKELIIRPFGT